MIYVEKSTCPKEIQEDLDAQKAKPEWDTIPEVPDSEQVKRLREEFFDKLNKDREHRYFRCPKCGQTVRVPRGRGKINIRCPRCNERFIKNT